MKNLIIRINFILILGLMIYTSIIIGGKCNKVYAADMLIPTVKKVAKGNNEVKPENKINLSSIQINNKNINEIKPSDIPDAHLKKIVIGPKSRKKLNMDKEEDTSSSTVSQSCGAENGRPITLNITFYTDLDSENGGCGGWVANNQRIQPGMVAAGWHFGTKLYIPSFKKHIAGLDGIQTFSVQDRMAEAEEAKADNRVDVYVPRLPGEGTSHYRDRVNSYGRYSVQAYIS